MNKLTQAVIMLLLGGSILKATLTDVFLRYVKAGLRPYLLVAGVLLVAAAVMTIWYELRSGAMAPAEADKLGDEHKAGKEDKRSNEREPGEKDKHEHGEKEGHGHGEKDGHGHGEKDGHEHGETDGHGHDHAHEPRVGWLLILPVIALLLITPPALGSYAAGQAGAVALSSDSDYPPLPAGDPAQIGLLDYASRAIFDGGKSLSGRTLEVSGFITPGPDGHPMLARIVLTCCAADGRPIKIGLAGTTTIDAPPDSWVQVIGVYSTQVGKDPVNQSDVAYLEVKSWQEISEPKQPYA